MRIAKSRELPTDTSTDDSTRRLLRRIAPETFFTIATVLIVFSRVCALNAVETCGGMIRWKILRSTMVLIRPTIDRCGCSDAIESLENTDGIVAGLQLNAPFCSAKIKSLTNIAYTSFIYLVIDHFNPNI